MMWKSFAILFLGMTPVLVKAVVPINNTNWLNHPEVRQIRSLYAAINVDQKAGTLKPESRACVLYDGAVEITGTTYKDHRRVIRKYTITAGTGDSMGTVEYYYDSRGVPRFTYKTNNAYNGTKKQDRIYFNTSGIHLYTNHRQEGVGYPQGGLDDVVRNPAAHYAQLCEE